MEYEVLRGDSDANESLFFKALSIKNDTNYIVETPAEWNEYNGFFAVKAGSANIDTTQTRNYVN